MAESKCFAAIASLYGGAPASLELLAEATGRSPARLRSMATKFSWQAADPQKTESSTSGKINDLLVQVQAIIDDKLTGSLTTKSDIDAVLGLLRLVEKLQSITNEQSPANNQKEVDEPHNQNPSIVRAALQKIDAQIDRLAQKRAEHLLSEKLEQEKPQHS